MTVLSPFTGSPLLGRRPLGGVVPVRDLRNPLTAPITLQPSAPTRSDPGYWVPRDGEPIYRSVWVDHRDRLHAGLLSGAGEAVPA